MDRLFLAMIVSGVLLASVAMSLFVASTGGERTVTGLNIPQVPGIAADTIKTRDDEKGPKPVSNDEDR